MTPAECKDYIMKFLYYGQGDDLERARMAFKWHSPEEMNKKFGQSGKTCNEILKEYEEGRKQHLEAMEWLRRQ